MAEWDPAESIAKLRTIQSRIHLLAPTDPRSTVTCGVFLALFSLARRGPEAAALALAEAEAWVTFLAEVQGVAPRPRRPPVSRDRTCWICRGERLIRDVPCVSCGGRGVFPPYQETLPDACPT